MMRRLAALLFLVFILLVILAADTGSIPPLLHAVYDFPYGDKVGHFILYGTLAFLLARAFPRGINLGRLFLPYAILALVVFAAAEEYSQRFFSTRTFDLVDLTFSCLGILTGTWLALRKKE